LFEGVDDKLLTEDECIELARFAEMVDHFGGVAHLSVTDLNRVKELQAKGQRQQAGDECSG
jgi:hypothetical protein